MSGAGGAQTRVRCPSTYYEAMVGDWRCDKPRGHEGPHEAADLPDGAVNWNEVGRV